jgi:hypothetical protein
MDLHFPGIECARLAGLPDGIFLNQKIPTWVNFEGFCNGICCYIFG